MTHENIYTKFMIEYDKANITSSYPSLTKYEVATMLDKAYLAVIAQKVTGNNPRKALFETDIKAIEDLRPLITNRLIYKTATTGRPENETTFTIPDNFMFYISSNIVMTNKETTESVDGLKHNTEIVQIIDHNTATKFMVTAYNSPWIKKPVCFVEGNLIRVLVDPLRYKDKLFSYDLTYIKKPNSFKQFDGEFELSDYMAEEVINQAILFATENTQSPRMQTKVSTLSLES